MMKKKTMIMFGIVSAIGVSSCNETSTDSASVPISGAARVVAVDSVNDRVIADTSMAAVVRNKPAMPQIEIKGLRAKNIFAKKNDLLFFTFDSDVSLLERKKLESFRLYSYHAN